MHKLPLVIALGITLSILSCENKKDNGIYPKMDPTAQIDATSQSSIERETFIKQIQQEIDIIEQQQLALEEKLAGLKKSIGEKWKELKADVSAAKR